MSTTAVSAGQIMDRVANLLNDPNKTDYTYPVIIPYLNMAIEELSELLEESNSSPTTQTIGIFVPAGPCLVTAEDDPFPLPPTIQSVHYPNDLVEVQEVRERPSGNQDGSLAFKLLNRKEIFEHYPSTNSLVFWIWQNQRIIFNQPGATIPMDIQVTYVGQGIPYIANENSIITMMNSRSYLSYKTAAFCAMFIGENESRAQMLDDQASKAVERITTISNKGRQQIMTRHRPFRAAYKSRGMI